MRIVGDQAPEISAGILREEKSSRLQSKMKYLWGRFRLWAGSVSQDIFNLVFRHDLFAHHCRACKTLSNSEVLEVMLHRLLECQRQQPQGIEDICALSKCSSFLMIHVDRALSNIICWTYCYSWYILSENHQLSPYLFVCSQDMQSLKLRGSPFLCDKNDLRPKLISGQNWSQAKTDLRPKLISGQNWSQAKTNLRPKLGSSSRDSISQPTFSLFSISDFLIYLSMSDLLTTFIICRT
jgi:hypothetical protein